MKEQDQIKALAELDGFRFEYGFNVSHYQNQIRWTDSHGSIICGAKDYLTSYDAVIPVIQKQGNEIAKALVLEIVDGSELADYTGLRLFHSSPTELCEALLRATGKWKD